MIKASITHDDLAQLDELIEQVQANPDFIRMADAGVRPVTAAVAVAVTNVTSCIYLMAHGAGDPYLDEVDRLRRVDFARNATVEDLLRVRAAAVRQLDAARVRRAQKAIEPRAAL